MPNLLMIVKSSLKKYAIKFLEILVVQGVNATVDFLRNGEALGLGLITYSQKATIEARKTAAIKV